MSELLNLYASIHQLATACFKGVLQPQPLSPQKLVLKTLSSDKTLLSSMIVLFLRNKQHQIRSNQVI
ncbi:hypothetical protein VTN77DRAFT_3894 [Rasamsonia byssochlamydoides]|uniref:uncharacterized protein n=1 Tax=Rasamsonia byssochlamydoides TaxID=89139 RepID=UPI00374273D4